MWLTRIVYKITLTTGYYLNSVCWAAIIWGSVAKRGELWMVPCIFVKFGRIWLGKRILYSLYWTGTTTMTQTIYQNAMNCKKYTGYVSEMAMVHDWIIIAA